MQTNSCLWLVVATLVSLSTAKINRPPYVGSQYPHGHGPYGRPPTTVSTPPECWSADIVARAIQMFGADLYASLTSEGHSYKGSLVFSPFSVTMALSMAWVGAEGQTDMQIAGTLRYMVFLPGNCKFKEGHRELLKLLSAKKYRHSLHIVNRVFLERRFRLLKTYTKTLHHYYFAGVNNMSFRRNPEKCRRRINRWVKKQTNGQIANLMPRRSVSKDTVLMLVNALTFQARWKYPFVRGLTKRARFYHSTKKYVNMMSSCGPRKLLYVYERAIDAYVVELPFIKSRVVMYVIVPRGKLGLPFIEQRSSIWNPKSLRLRMKLRLVEVKLPKFRIRSQLSLKKPLKRLGTKLVFDPQQANFEHIAGRRGLWVDDVYHQAFMNVNEQGTAASAATAIAGCVRRSSRASSVKFVANRPFLFHLVDLRKDILLFTGRFIG